MFTVLTTSKLEVSREFSFHQLMRILAARFHETAVRRISINSAAPKATTVVRSHDHMMWDSTTKIKATQSLFPVENGFGAIWELPNSPTHVLKQNHTRQRTLRKFPLIKSGFARNAKIDAVNLKHNDKEI